MEISATSSSIKPSNTSNTSNNENTTQTTIALGGNEPGEVGSTFEGKTFVIHGYDVNKEQALRAVITKLGGEIESSVTENTSFLITTPAEAKHINRPLIQGAIRFGVPVLSEAFIWQFTTISFDSVNGTAVPSAMNTRSGSTASLGLQLPATPSIAHKRVITNSNNNNNNYNSSAGGGSADKEMQQQQQQSLMGSLAGSNDSLGSIVDMAVQFTSGGGLPGTQMNNSDASSIITSATGVTTTGRRIRPPSISLDGSNINQSSPTSLFSFGGGGTPLKNLSPSITIQESLEDPDVFFEPPAVNLNDFISTSGSDEDEENGDDDDGSADATDNDDDKSNLGADGGVDKPHQTSQENVAQKKKSIFIMPLYQQKQQLDQQQQDQQQQQQPKQKGQQEQSQASTNSNTRLEWQRLLTQYLTGDEVETEKMKRMNARAFASGANTETLWLELSARAHKKRVGQHKREVEDRRHKLQFLVPLAMEFRIQSSDVAGDDETRALIDYVLQQFETVMSSYSTQDLFELDLEKFMAGDKMAAGEFLKRVDAMQAWMTISRQSREIVKRLRKRARMAPDDSSDLKAIASEIAKELMHSQTIDKIFKSQVMRDVRLLISQFEATVIEFKLTAWSQLGLGEEELVLELVKFPMDLMNKCLEVWLQTAQQLFDTHAKLTAEKQQQKRQQQQPAQLASRKSASSAAVAEESKHLIGLTQLLEDFKQTLRVYSNLKQEMREIEDRLSKFTGIRMTTLSGSNDGKEESNNLNLSTDAVINFDITHASSPSSFSSTTNLSSPVAPQSFQQSQLQSQLQQIHFPNGSSKSSLVNSGTAVTREELLQQQQQQQQQQSPRLLFRGGTSSQASVSRSFTAQSASGGALGGSTASTPSILSATSAASQSTLENLPLAFYLKLLKAQFHYTKKRFWYRAEDLIMTEWEFLKTITQVQSNELVVSSIFSMLTDLIQMVTVYTQKVMRPSSSALEASALRSGSDADESQLQLELEKRYAKHLDHVRVRVRKLMQVVKVILVDVECVTSYQMDKAAVKSLIDRLLETGHVVIDRDSQKVVYSMLSSPGQRLCRSSTNASTSNKQSSPGCGGGADYFGDSASDQRRRDSEEADLYEYSIVLPNISSLGTSSASSSAISVSRSALNVSGAPPVPPGQTTLPIPGLNPGTSSDQPASNAKKKMYPVMFVTSNGPNHEELRKRLMAKLRPLELTGGERGSVYEKCNQSRGRVHKAIVRCLCTLIKSIPTIRLYLTTATQTNSLGGNNNNSNSNLGSVELLENFFSFSSSFGIQVLPILPINFKSFVVRYLIELSIEWITFTCSDCSPLDRKTFRWALMALEFTMWVTRGGNVLMLSEEAFWEIRRKVACCMTLLISGMNADQGQQMQQDGGIDIDELNELLKFEDDEDDDDDQEEEIGTHNSEEFEGGADGIDRSKRGKGEAVIDLVDKRRDMALLEAKRIGKVLDTANNPTVLQLQQLLTSSISTISIRWQQGKYVGGGTFGKVYLGINLDTGDLMAVKEIEFNAGLSQAGNNNNNQNNNQNNNRNLENHYSHILRVRDEMKVLEQLNHPNIIQYYGIEVHLDKCLLFMEYCSNGSLRQLLVESTGGRIEEELIVCLYSYQLLEGIKYLHSQKIIHRDIKPDNILFDYSGTLKLVDFGASKIIRDAPTSSNPSPSPAPGGKASLTGTPCYMSPEVVTGKTGQGHFGGQDIWAFGCCVVEMATGKRPWSHLDNEWAILYHIGLAHEHPELPSTTELSADGIEFCQQCFLRVAERPSASDLLSHTFLGDLKRRLEEFQKSNALQQSGYPNPWLIGSSVTSTMNSPTASASSLMMKVGSFFNNTLSTIFSNSSATSSTVANRPPPPPE